MAKLEAGTRVVHGYLGAGTVVRQIMDKLLTLVRWDTTPDVRYNMAQNPAVAHTHELTLEADDGALAGAELAP